MNNNYHIVRAIFENDFQRVLECRNNDTNEIFYSNVITSPKIMGFINLEELKNLNTNILKSYNTEDRIYIYTKPLSEYYKSLKEYIASGISLKQQFYLVEEVIKLSSQIYDMTDVVQQKILDLDRLYISTDEKLKIIADCNLVFEKEYDISHNETFERMSDIIHFIFAGVKIIDFNISGSIPPDLEHIMVKCLGKEYENPINALEELKTSSVYEMLFGITNEDEKLRVKKFEKLKTLEFLEKNEDDQENNDISKEEKNIEKKDDNLENSIFSNKNDIEKEENSNNIKEDANILKEYELSNADNLDISEIYMKVDNIENTKKNTRRNLKNVVVPILLVIIVLLLGSYIVKKYGNIDLIKLPSINNEENINQK